METFQLGDAPNPPLPCREGLGAQEALSILPLVAGGEVADRVLFRCSGSRKETHELCARGTESCRRLPAPLCSSFSPLSSSLSGTGCNPARLWCCVRPRLASRSCWRGGQGCWQPSGCAGRVLSHSRCVVRRCVRSGQLRGTQMIPKGPKRRGEAPPAPHHLRVEAGRALL